MNAAKNLSESMERIQDELRTLTDSGHKFADPDVERLAHVVSSLANVVDGLVHGESVPSTNGVAIR